MQPMKLGLIGLDTSHVEHLAAIFNDPAHAGHIPGRRIVAAFPGGSPDFPLSIERMPKYRDRLRGEFGIEMLDSPAAVAAQVDAVLHTTVDGRRHPAEFAAIAPFGRPVFMDKPFAVTSADARAMADLADRHGVRLFSSSNLRFAEQLRTALADDSGGPVTGADFHGPMAWQPTQPGYFWYGIHVVEMLYAAFGRGCAAVSAIGNENHDVVTARWADGRLGALRGNRLGNRAFGGVIHRPNAVQVVDASAGRPAHLALAGAIAEFFGGGPAPVDLATTVEIVRFIEAANESRAAGGREVAL